MFNRSFLICLKVFSPLACSKPPFLTFFDEQSPQIRGQFQSPASLYRLRAGGTKHAQCVSDLRHGALAQVMAGWFQSEAVTRGNQRIWLKQRETRLPITWNLIRKWRRNWEPGFVCAIWSARLCIESIGEVCDSGSNAALPRIKPCRFRFIFRPKEVCSGTWGWVKAYDCHSRSGWKSISQLSMHE